MELIIGVDMAKKSLPKTLAKEIEIKKEDRLKENGSINVLGLVNKYSTKESKNSKTTSRSSNTN